MEFTLIDNGIDSLQKGYKKLEQYEELYITKPHEKKERYFHLKDAVLSIHHGVEILMKHILSNESEYLIYTKIDNDIKNAYLEVKRKKLESVFQTSLNSKINTISYIEAFERLDKICGYEFSKKLSTSIIKLNDFRNQITHATISVDEDDVKQLFKNFIDDMDIFFFRAIGEEYKTLSGYDDLVKNHKRYLELLDKAGLDVKKKAVSFFKETFDKHGISMGFGEVKSISDINVAFKIVSELFESDFRFGGDFYNRHTTGSITKVERLDKDRIALFSSDNNVQYRFRFKSLILYLPSIMNNESPILFFVSDNDTDYDEKYSEDIEIDKGKRYLEGIHFTESNITIYNAKDKDDYYTAREYDPEFEWKEYHYKINFLDSVIIGFVNIQRLEFRRFMKLVSAFHEIDEETLLGVLRRTLKK